MFDWLFKKQKLNKKLSDNDSNILFEKPIDAIESALWEIKEEYDLPTEEVTDLVHSKRKNLNYLYECVKNNKS
jgi:hypothetical protein|tara:strand:- start:8948 stop:9166 length:219 start_codon:yes stop_codon:yes gene_type:complete